MQRNNGSNKFSKEKYEEKFQLAITNILRRELADPRLQMMSVTKVDLNQDYSQAKVFWDTFDSSRKEEIGDAVGSISSKVRSELARKLDVRHIPEIVFIYDSQYEDEHRITELLNKE